MTDKRSILVVRPEEGTPAEFRNELQTLAESGIEVQVVSQKEADALVAAQHGPVLPDVGDLVKKIELPPFDANDLSGSIDFTPSPIPNREQRRKAQRERKRKRKHKRKQRRKKRG